MQNSQVWRSKLTDERRIYKLNDLGIKHGPVIYWMQRDQRVNDNWALIFAQQKAVELNKPLIVVFNLVDKFLRAEIRQFGFMIKGLREIENSLTEKNIPFKLLIGKHEETLPQFIDEINCGLLITDFSPLKISRDWKSKVNENITIPFYEIDASNIVPVKIASGKLEFAAYTIRPKIKKLLPEFLLEFPKIEIMKKSDLIWRNNLDNVLEKLKIGINVPEVNWLQPGEYEAHITLQNFIKNKVTNYNELRNDPNSNAVSNLSPYLHFGQISSQRIALEILQTGLSQEVTESFLEELIVRRELSDNFCFYNHDYDNFNGFHEWAKTSLNLHRNDKREFIYSKNQFENAETHDQLWNTAQTEMVKTGKMHGYIRMYWAKKILEWTDSPEAAIETAIYLNDKYELDGRDPNGYTGIAWSIGGVHDRAWTERPVYGKIRYMNYNGCKRKFDVNSYIQKYIENSQTNLF